MASTEILTSIVNDYSPNFVLKREQFEVLAQLFESPSSDIIVSWPTGFGKSVLFHLCGRVLARSRAVELLHPVTIVVVPLNLIQSDQMASLANVNIAACLLDVKGNASSAQRYSDTSGSEWSGSDEDMYEDEYEKLVETEASFTDIVNGRYEVVLTHPEALLCTEFGSRLLASEEFCSRVVALAIDECHTIDQWGSSFRKAFSQLKTLPGYFNCPIICLSATIPEAMFNNLRKELGLQDPHIFRVSPDKTNIFYDKRYRPPSQDIFQSMEAVYAPELERLILEKNAYPVTLLYMPLEWAANAQRLMADKIGYPVLGEDRYGVLFSNQDKDVKDHIIKELKSHDPKIRLVMCSATIGMGFDSPSVIRVIHGRPPRTMIDLVQQVGRAGRMGQSAVSLIYYNENDIAINLPVSDDIRQYCRATTCLRELVLKHFGFQKDKSVFVTDCTCCINCKEVCCCDECGKSS